MKTRWEKRQEKESLKQAGKYLLLVLGILLILVKFGLPGLIKLAGFLGTVRSTSQPIEITENQPVLAPRLLPLAEATNSSQIDINGLAQAGTTIKLFLRGISIQETVTDADGNFKFDKVHLKDGDNEIFTEASFNQAGSSQASNTLKINVDTAPPILEITKPDQGQRFFDKDSPIIISGQSEAGVNLTINGRFVLVKDDASFSTSYNLSGGDNQLELVAIDAAGNETKKTLTVNYTP